MNIMNRFSKKFFRFLKILVPVLLLLFLCIAFLLGIRQTSGETLQKEQAVLEQALRHGAIHTYALQGRYPENLKQLLEAYHITYDKEKFLVEYIPNGSNLFPGISVIPRSAEKGGHS